MKHTRRRARLLAEPLAKAGSLDEHEKLEVFPQGKVASGGFWINARHVAVALVACWVTFILLLLIPMAVPDEPVIARYEAGVGIALSSVESVPIGGLADSFTECLELMVNSGQNRLLAVARADYPRFDQVPCVQYQTAAADGTLAAAIADSISYFRYWHGTNVLMRPVFAYLGMDALRVIAGGLVIFGFALLFSAVGRVMNWWAAVAIIIPPLLMSDAAWLAFSVHQALAVAALLVMAAVVLVITNSSRPTVYRFLWAGVAAAGAVASFVDVLNVAPISWLLTTAAVSIGLIGSGLNRLTKPSKIFAWTVMASILWAVGFGLTWALRWLLAVPFVGFSTVWADVSGAILVRGGSKPGQWTDGWTVTLAWWDRVALGGVRPAVALLVAVGVVLLIRLARAGSGSRGRLMAGFCIVAWPGALVPIWFILLGQQAADHGWFMYRGWAYALGVVAAAAFVPLSFRASNGDTSSSLTRG